MESNIYHNLKISFVKLVSDVFDVVTPVISVEIAGHIGDAWKVVSTLTVVSFA